VNLRCDRTMALFTLIAPHQHPRVATCLYFRILMAPNLNLLFRALKRHQMGDLTNDHDVS
jgi:hypothetical protein